MKPLHHDYALIERTGQLLLLENDYRFTLPQVTTAAHFWQSCAPVNQAIRQHYGLTVTTLRCLNTQYTPGDPPLIRNLYAMEWQSGDLPSAGRWVALADLPLLELDTPFDLPTMQRWIQPSPSARPWFNPGWYARQMHPIPARLERHGLRLTDNPQQLRSWERGTVIRLPTDAGDLYLKHVPPMFAHEPALTGWLAQHEPDLTPVVLEAGDDLLMRDYGGQPLLERPDLSLWEAALHTYARLQQRMTSRLDELRRLGVPERGWEWLRQGVATLLTDDAALRQLDEASIAQLRGLLPRVESVCDQLADAGLPLSLEHGDLWTGQIIVHKGRFIISDWSDSAITCPWFSLPFFLAELANELPGVADARVRLEQAYLSAWDIDAAQWYPLVELLSPLYTAVRYHADILPAMEQRWEMENMVAYNLRLALRSMRE